METLKAIIIATLYELQPVRVSDILYWMKSIWVSFVQCIVVLKDFVIWSKKDMFSALRVYLTLSNLWYLTVWSSGLYIMIYFEFGSLWIILSLFAIIIYNLDDRRDGDRSLSSYSIFNKGFRNILGALTAEQFDREIRHNNNANDLNGDVIRQPDADEDMMIDRRHLRRGKKARRGYEDKLIRRHQQQLQELDRMIEGNAENFE